MFKNRILVYKHQVSDHDEMLEKWPGCKINTDLRNQLKNMETLHKVGIYQLLAVFRAQMLMELI